MVTPDETIAALNKRLKELAPRLNGQEEKKLEIYCVSPLGGGKFQSVTAHDERYLIVKMENEQDLIVLPEQCAFVFSVVDRKADEPVEKPQIGFR